MDHETGEALERSGNANSRANFDQDAFCSVDVDLQLASLVDGRVQQSKQTLKVEVSSPLQQHHSMYSHLMRDVRSSVTDVATHLAHDTNVFIAVQERVLLLLSARFAAVCGTVGFERGIRQYHDESLSVLVRRSNWHMLLGDESRKFGGRKGLSSWRG